MKLTIKVTHGNLEPVELEVLIPGIDSEGYESHFVEIMKRYGKEGNWAYLAGYVADAVSDNPVECKWRFLGEKELHEVSFN